MNRKFIFFLLFFILIYPASAAINLTISSESPIVGDEIIIKGNGASPNQVITPVITFDNTVSVANGKYDYRLYGINIPSGKNNFVVNANNVKDLNVRVKIIIWITMSKDAVGGKAIVSQGNVPSGNYDIIIDGNAQDGISSVPLTITASTQITADAQGNFEYKASTSGMPEGIFNLNIAGISKQIRLSSRTPVPTVVIPSNSGGGGGGGGISGEDFINIEVKEKRELSIFKDVVTSYEFKNISNPIYLVNIIGNVNAGDITTSIEVLKETSSLIKVSAPGKIYKNINIWVGTSGFAIPKNIKDALINFRVEQSWISENNFTNSNIKMFRWNGNNWEMLETSYKNSDDVYAYYETKTDSFSSFAISGVSPDITPIATTPKPEQTTPKASPIPTASPTPVEVPGFEFLIGIIALAILRKIKMF